MRNNFLSCCFMLGSAPGAKDVVIPPPNVSNLKKPPVTTGAAGAVTIEAAAAVATEETVTTGKDSSGLICYAYTRLRIYV